MSGNIDAQKKIAKLYLVGKGTQVNMKKSYAWLSVASVNKDPEALRALEMVSAQLDQSDLLDAQSIATEIFQSMTQ